MGNLEKIHDNAAGIDIGSEKIFVATDKQPVKSYRTFTNTLQLCVKDLQSQNIRTVAMEATGVYWVTIYDMLEKAGMDVWLVNPADSKNLPGRKTDVQDCQWIQQLHSYGLLRRSFIPDETFRQLRTYNRIREDHIQMASSHVQHMQKALISMNIRLPEVISQIHGKSGMQMIEAILEGNTDTKHLLSLCDARLRKNKREEILQALQGFYSEEHLFELKQAYDAYHFYQFQIAECDKKMGKLNWNPNFIHAQSVINGGIFAHYLSDKFKVTYFITEHQVFLMHFYSKYEQNMMRFAIKNAKCFMVVSEHQKRQILMNGISCNPVVLGNMVDDSIFTISKAKKDVFNILVVTYPHYIKDNETLYKAIRCLLSEQVKDFKVQIVGGDLNNTALTDKENPLYKEAENYGITEYVEILNHVEREKMPEIINTCDVLVSTSIAETFGIACCEAMMCGVPVISTANGGIDEMISEKNGIKIPIRDEKALAAAILQIKNKVITFNPDEIRNSVVEKFGRNAFKTKSSEIYDSV